MIINYQDLLVEYGEIVEQLKNLSDRKDEIKEKIGNIMHIEDSNELIITDSSEAKWRCVYQEKKTKSIDYGLLLQEVGEKIYNDIVGHNISESLYIRKYKKKKSGKKSKVAPKRINNSSSPPVGMIK